MCDTIIAYNVRFDYKVIQAEYLRLKIGFPFRQHNRVDAMRSAQKILGLKVSHKISLANAAKQILGNVKVFESSIDMNARHDAMSDVVATALIYLIGNRVSN
jgi:DNA polymerase III epsilon subunit-like protein